MKALLIVLITLFAFGCSHTFDVVLQPGSPTLQKRVEANELALQENKIPDGVKLVETNLGNHFILKNETKDDLFVEYEKSAIVQNGVSSRVVPGETRKLFAQQAVPDQIVASGTSAEISFYIPKEYASNEYEKLIVSLRSNDKSFRVVKVNVESPERIGEVRYVNEDDGDWCMYTFWLYGGYCWVIQFSEPNEEDFKGAREKAMTTFNLQKDEFILEPN